MATSSNVFMPSDGFEPIIPWHPAFFDDYATMPLLVNVTSLATMLAVSPRTVYRLVEVGELPQPLHIGRLAHWRTVDVFAFVELRRERKA